MGNQVNYSNGQSLVSSALTPRQMMAIFQSVTANLLGLTSNLQIQGSPVLGSEQVTMATTIGIANGWFVSDAPGYGYGLGGYGEGGYGDPQNIPPGTTVTAILGDVITMSNMAVGSAVNEWLWFTSPAANFAVRTSWQTKGAPAWSIEQDVCFVRAVPEEGWYNKVRDQSVTYGDDDSVVITREYTRLWRVFWNAWGPNCHAHVSQIISGLLLEVSSEPLAGFNLYVETDLPSPQYAPELDDGRWWERTSFEATFYEQVTDTITVPTVESVELIIKSQYGQAADFTVTAS